MHTAHDEELAFFGRMGRHVSHELKNVLATISETAGLLLDLMELHGRGGMPGGARLVELCGRIVSVVERGNVTVQALNRFAHSVDDPVSEVDLCGLGELMIELAKYFPYARKVVLDPGSCRGMQVRTNPFLIMNLLHEFLLPLFPRLGLNGEVVLRLACEDSEALLELVSPIPLDATAPWQDRVKALAKDLGGGVAIDAAKGRCLVRLPSLSEG